MGIVAQGLRYCVIPVVTLIPSRDKLAIFITHNIQPLWVAVIVILGAHVEDWIHDLVCVCVGSLSATARGGCDLTPSCNNQTHWALIDSISASQSAEATIQNR